MPSIHNELKCHLSEAYLQAVSAVIGFPCSISCRRLDHLKIDAHFTVAKDFGVDAKRHVFTVYIQPKATSDELKWDRGKCRFEIDVDLYDKFRTTKTQEPMYILVLVLPDKHEKCKWLTCTPTALSIKGCAYYVSLYGAKEVPNTSTITVTLRRKDQVSALNLHRIVTDFAMRGEMVPYED